MLFFQLHRYALSIMFSVAPSIKTKVRLPSVSHIVLVSTELVPVTRMRRTRSFVWLILLVLILLLSVVALVAWKRFSTARSVYQMNDEQIDAIGAGDQGMMFGYAEVAPLCLAA